MDRRQFLAAGVAASWSSAVPGFARDEPLRGEPDVADKIDVYFRPLAASHDLSGVLRIERGGRVTEACYGFADWATGIPITPQTRFAAGSIIKSMIATLILEQQRDGLLDPARPVSAYVPEYEAGAAISVGDVMSHRAGLPRDTPQGTQATPQLIAWLNERPPAPTQEPSYSNVGYDLLALVAARVGGGSVQDLVQDRILGRLGLDETGLEATSFNTTSARPHEPGPPPSEVHLADPEHFVTTGLFATAGDLARWGRAVRDGALVPLRHEDGTWAGSVEEREIGGHKGLFLQGSITGGGATVLTFDDVSVVCAVNLASYPQFNAERVLAKIAFGIDPGAPPEQQRFAGLDETHRELAGTYEIPGLGRVRVHETEGNMLLTVVEPGWTYYLTPASEGRLVLRKFNYAFAARRDDAGLTTGLRARLHMLDETAGEIEVDRIA